ncbi:MAG: terpene cyclase/mutase family protein [Deltaproteobacteria bacterium]|nr:terpene cyclase/mutase family protein [Deltaproteobacteria bacterium]
MGYTAEVLQAISQQPTAISSGVVAKGVAFMENVVPHDTGALARKLAISHQPIANSYVRTEDVSTLASLRTTNGGYPAWFFYDEPDLFRTFSALNFLAGYDPAAARQTAVYLASTQNLDGSFGIAHDVGTAAQVILAFSLTQSYAPVSGAIQAGLDFIVSQANPDGFIGTLSDPILDTLLGVLAVQTISGDINVSFQPSAVSCQPSGPNCTSMVQSGIAYLASQLHAQSSIRGDAYLTALYVRVATNLGKQVGSRTEKSGTKLAGKLPDAAVGVRDKGKVVPWKDLSEKPKRKLPSVQNLSRPPSLRLADRLPNMSDLVGVEDGLCTVQDVTPRLGNDVSGGGLAAFVDGRPHQIGTPITEEGKHVLMIEGTGDTVRFVIDRTPPTIEVRGITDGNTIDGPVTPSIAAQDENFAGMTTTLNGLPFESGTAVVENGTYELAVTAWGCAGNLEEKTVSFVVSKTR